METQSNIMWKPQKTMSNIANFIMGEIDKSRELYFREGDNYCQFDGKNSTVGTHYCGTYLEVYI